MIASNLRRLSYKHFLERRLSKVHVYNLYLTYKKAQLKNLPIIELHAQFTKVHFPPLTRQQGGRYGTFNCLKM